MGRFREHITNLFRPCYLKKMVEIRDYVNGARADLDGMIAKLPGEDQWLIRKQIDATAKGEDSPCTHTRTTRPSASGG
jgi:hypothetical protein